MPTPKTISVSEEDAKFLKENRVKPSKLFREAVVLSRMIIQEEGDSFPPEQVTIFKDAVQRKIHIIGVLQKEIERRNERIESLQDVLAKKELGE